MSLANPGGAFRVRELISRIVASLGSVALPDTSKVIYKQTYHYNTLDRSLARAASRLRQWTIIFYRILFYSILFYSILFYYIISCYGILHVLARAAPRLQAEEKRPSRRARYLPEDLLLDPAGPSYPTVIIIITIITIIIMLLLL